MNFCALILCLQGAAQMKQRGFTVSVLYFFVAVNFICDHPAIKAISFVGSNSAGEYIYERGSKNGKRVQSNMVHQNLQYFLFILTTLRINI